VRFGLFGTGHWARHTQGAALVAHPDVDLVGVWGRDPAKAAALATDLGTTPYADPDELIAAVEAVAIALPPDVQAPLAARAARAGRHLMLDKPLALDVAAADEVVAAVESTGVASVVFFTTRFVPSVAAFLADAPGRGFDGAQIVMCGSIFQTGSPYGSSVWRKEKGGLWDVGPHALALVLPVLGPVTDIRALAGPHDTAHLLLRHAAGAVSHLTLTVNAPPGAVRWETSFIGPNGLVPTPPADATPLHAFGLAIDALYAAAAVDQPGHPCDVRFAREVVAVLAQARDRVETPV
jgi:predicted dehydrogenase